MILRTAILGSKCRLSGFYFHKPFTPMAGVKRYFLPGHIWMESVVVDSGQSVNFTAKNSIAANGVKWVKFKLLLDSGSLRKVVDLQTKDKL